MMRRSVVTAVILAVLVGGWIASGQIDVLKGEVHAVPAPAVAPASVTEPLPQKVRGRVLRARARISELVVRGHTEAVRSVDIRAETYGRIIEIAVAKGAWVERGDIVARLALDARQARLREAEALVRQRQIEHDAAQRLAAKGFRARTQSAGAVAALDAARAAVARMKMEIEHTVIRAPFDGIIEKRYAEIGDYVQVADEVAALVDQDPYLFVAHVNERDIGKLRVGMAASARPVTGEPVSGKLRYIATKADAATRTFRIEVEVANPRRLLRAGVTSEIRIPIEEVRAHLMSPALLALDDQGAVGVRIVDADGLVEFHPVRIVADEAAGLWLAGLPETVTVITVGQEYVRNGDKVEVVLESPAS